MRNDNVYRNPSSGRWDSIVERAETRPDEVIANLYFDSLPMTGLLHPDSHIRKINILLAEHAAKFAPGETPPGNLEVIGTYLRNAKKPRGSLAPQSLNVVAGGVKTSVKLKLGSRYTFDLIMQFAIDAYFKQFYSSKATYTEIQRVPESEIQKLLDAPGGRTKLWDEWFYVTGCRNTESCEIRLTDLRPGSTPEETYVFLRETKFNRPREIAVPSELVYKILLVFQPKVFLFETEKHTKFNRKCVYKMTTEHSLNVLGYKVNPHRLRHSTAEELVEKNPGEINAIAKHLGNSPGVLISKYLNQKLKASTLPMQTQRATIGMPATGNVLPENQSA